MLHNYLLDLNEKHNKYNMNNEKEIVDGKLKEYPLFDS